MEPQNLSGTFNSLSSNLREYVNLKISLYKLMATEALAQAASHLMITIVLFLLGMFLLFFLSLAFVFWFGEQTGSTWGGSLIVAGLYLILIVIIFLKREKLFLNPLIQKLTLFIQEEEEASDED